MSVRDATPAQHVSGWLRSLQRRLKARIGTAGASASNPAAADAPCEWFDVGDIDRLLKVYEARGDGPANPWQPYVHAHMRLPPWFKQGLDPWSADYAAQQQRLWGEMVKLDRAYEPEMDEQEFGWKDADPIRLPGFYARRDAQAVVAASDHILATGMLLKHSGLRPGDWALEYGAGFGQSALALARLGVNVDTVDISEVFNGFVAAQASHFAVPLHAHHGRFGTNPRSEQRYKLIWFYESFHHCVDFMRVVPMLANHLAEGGRIVLGGEPIVEREYAAVPYPWGVRLHSEVAMVMRQTRWFELGFSEAFLYELFRRAGFTGARIDCEPSLFGRLYVFQRNS